VNEKEFIATTLKSAQKALEHTATTSAKIAVKRATKKSSNNDQQSPEEYPSQTVGPTMANVWLKTLENNAKNAVSPVESLLAIDKMIKDEKNKLIENKKKEIIFKSIIDKARNNITTLLG